MRMAGWRIPGALILVVLVLGSCGGGSEAQNEALVKAEIQKTLELYLPQMALAYRSGNLEPLRQWAVEKEVATLYKRVLDLSGRGLTVDPKLKSVTVETIGVWGHSNALATTLEVWDVRYYAEGTDSLVSEELDQANRVKYQFKLEGERWWVLYRSLEAVVE